MSKKVKKKVAKKAAKKTVKKAVKGVARRAAAQSKRTSAATIFVYDTGGGIRVRTSPQLLTCGDGFVEWTVVNLTSGPMPDVDITWKAGSPWGGVPIPVRGGNARLSLQAGQQGRFKYDVTCGGYTEDPELEYPEN